MEVEAESFFRTGHVTSEDAIGTALASQKSDSQNWARSSECGRWSTRKYSGTAVALHLISILSVRSIKSKQNS